MLAFGKLQMLHRLTPVSLKSEGCRVRACYSVYIRQARVRPCPQVVLDSGVRFSGATVHFVEEAYDTGPVLAQRAVPVLPDDTPASLAARVLVQVRMSTSM